MCVSPSATSRTLEDVCVCLYVCVCVLCVSDCLCVCLSCRRVCALSVCVSSFYIVTLPIHTLPKPARYHNVLVHAALSRRVSCAIIASVSLTKIFDHKRKETSKNDSNSFRVRTTGRTMRLRNVSSKCGPLRYSGLF